MSTTHAVRCQARQSRKSQHQIVQLFAFRAIDHETVFQTHNQFPRIVRETITNGSRRRSKSADVEAKSSRTIPVVKERFQFRFRAGKSGFFRESRICGGNSGDGGIENIEIHARLVFQDAQLNFAQYANHTVRSFPVPAQPEKVFRDTACHIAAASADTPASRRVGKESRFLNFFRSENPDVFAHSAFLIGNNKTLHVRGNASQSSRHNDVRIRTSSKKHSKHNGTWLQTGAGHTGRCG